MTTAHKALQFASRRLRGRLKDVHHMLFLDSGPPRTVMAVLGCQRSGTSALLRSLELDWNACVYDEFTVLNAVPESPDPDPRDPKFRIRFRPFEEVADVFRQAPYPLVVCKPLVESQRAPELLDKIASARCVWMFRNYRDVAESIVRTWPDSVHIRNLEPIQNAEHRNWRSEIVPDDVRELIRRHYATNMNPHDGGALFWYARNRLLFDLELVGDPRVLMLHYEEFATNPETTLERLYAFARIPYPGPKLARNVSARTVGRGADIALNEEIESCCEELWRELLNADQMGNRNHLD